MKTNTRGKTSIFQIALLVIFGVFIAGGVLFFAGFGGLGGDEETPIGSVQIWGTLDRAAFNETIAALRLANDRFGSISYEQRDAATFDAELTEALATGRGPDLILLSQDRILSYQNIVLLVSYDYYPQNVFRETFVEEGELFLTGQGIVGFPVTVDPLVLYWNRDLFSTAGIANPPRYWNEVYTVAETLSRESDTGDITRSGIALGEFVNVAHAKDILSTLTMQAGGSVVTSGASGLRAALNQGSGDQQPAASAVRFFTEFSNPTKDVYSWNRSLPESRSAFANGDAALYVGYASERGLIAAQNPNLNFGITSLPQAPGAERTVTYGRMHALAISRVADNPYGAREVARAISSASVSNYLASYLGTPSPRRDVLAAQQDGVNETLRTSALIARAWLDPDPSATDAIFRALIEDVTSGARRLNEAITRANSQIDSLLTN